MQAERRLAVGPGWAAGDFVFTRPDGKRLHPERLSMTFNETIRRHGLPPIPLHGLRHTWATLALEAGIHPRVVQERLGYASATVTL